jgi:hypothetical protein
MVNKFFRLSNRRKVLLLKAVVLSLYVRLKDFMPIKSIKPMQLEGQSDLALLSDIAWAIRVCHKLVPWQNVCRHQALCAVILCEEYGQALDVFVGFRKSAETGTVEGHTWTMASGKFITGACKVQEYTLQDRIARE